MTKSEQRKRFSEQFLERSGIAVDVSLPLFPQEESVRIRSKGEIARRAVAAFLTAQVAIGIIEGEDLQKSVAAFGYLLDKFNVRDELTFEERRYFDTRYCTGITTGDASETEWRAERCVPLFWSLGLMENELSFPSKITDINAISGMIGESKNLSGIIKDEKGLDIDDILGTADTCMRMHCACIRSRELDDPALKGNLHSKVVSEHYLGFCWLIGAYDDWDAPKMLFDRR